MIPLPSSPRTSAVPCRFPPNPRILFPSCTFPQAGDAHMYRSKENHLQSRSILNKEGGDSEGGEGFSFASMEFYETSRWILDQWNLESELGLVPRRLPASPICPRRGEGPASMGAHLVESLFLSFRTRGRDLYQEEYLSGSGNAEDSLLLNWNPSLGLILGTTTSAYAYSQGLLYIHSSLET